MVLGTWPPLDLCEIECCVLNKTTEKRTSENAQPVHNHGTGHCIQLVLRLIELKMISTTRITCRRNLITVLYLYANVEFGICMGSSLQRKGRAEGITQILISQHLVGIVRTTCKNNCIIHTINDNYFSMRHLTIGHYNGHGLLSEGRN